MNAPISKAEWERQRREAMQAIPDLVTEMGLPTVLLRYQSKTVELMESAAVEVLFIEKSRRIGETWALAAYAVLKAGKERKADGDDVMYISYAKEMTREFVDACAMWARAFSMVAADTEEYLFDDGDAEGDKSINAFRIRFASGFEIIALSSAPRTLRGKQGVVIIDEAAFVDNLSELLKAAMANLIWGGKVVVCSTHDGAENYFNQQVQDILAGRSSYSHIRIDLDQALKDGFYERICLVKGREWSPEAEANWRQGVIDHYGDGADEELFCIPSLGSGAWLPAPLIEARMTAEAPILRLELPNDYLQQPKLAQQILMTKFMEELEEALGSIDLVPQYAFGFDFARVADLTVGILMSIEQRLKRRQRLVFELRNVPGDEQKQITAMVLNHVRTRLIGAVFDATGMGWTVAEDMGRKFGLRESEDSAGLVWAIKFTEDWYRFNMPPLKTAIEDDTISITKDADHLSDLRSVKLVRGIPRVPATRANEKGDGGKKGKKRHGDYAIALALAHFASRMRWVEYAYRGATDNRRRADREPGRMQDTADQDDNQIKGRGWWESPLGAGIRGGLS